MSFELYKQAHDEMQDDAVVLELNGEYERLEKELEDLMEPLRIKINDVANSIALAEKPYLDRMGQAEEAIKPNVLEQAKTVVYLGVEAKYSAGRKSTSWKGVATEAGATDDHIAMHTKQGKPSVTVSVV